MLETLRPCPLCGGEAGVDKTNYYFKDSGERAMSSFVVSCRACGMKTAQHRTEDGAVMAWNRRKERTCRVGCYPPGYEDNLHYEVCSECGTILTASRPGDRHAARASYCPGCGARVVSDE